MFERRMSRTLLGKFTNTWSAVEWRALQSGIEILREFASTTRVKLLSRIAIDRSIDGNSLSGLFIWRVMKRVGLPDFFSLSLVFCTLATTEACDKFLKSHRGAHGDNPDR